MSQELFFSGSARDHNIIQPLTMRLKVLGFTTWWFKDDQYSGLHFRRELMKRIENCRAVVLVLSQNSVGSVEVEAEVDEALRWNRPIIPIRLDLSHGIVTYPASIRRLDYIVAWEGRDPLPDLLRALELPPIIDIPPSPQLVACAPFERFVLPTTYTLFVPPGANTPEPFTLCTIGRDPAHNTLVIHNCDETQTISRVHHAVISARLQDQGVWEFKLHPNSKNRTFLREQAIAEPQPLTQGAVIALPLVSGRKLEIIFSGLKTTSPENISEEEEEQKM